MSVGTMGVIRFGSSLAIQQIQQSSWLVIARTLVVYLKPDNDWRGEFPHATFPVPEMTTSRKRGGCRAGGDTVRGFPS